VLHLHPVVLQAPVLQSRLVATLPSGHHAAPDPDRGRSKF
jgi:hypothetical protein